MKRRTFLQALMGTPLVAAVPALAKEAPADNPPLPSNAMRVTEATTYTVKDNGTVWVGDFVCHKNSPDTLLGVVRSITKSPDGRELVSVQLNGHVPLHGSTTCVFSEVTYFGEFTYQGDALRRYKYPTT